MFPATCHPSRAKVMDGLKPCQFRQVDTSGRILCNLIKGGDREVSVNLCRACPVQAINCQHLRAGLQKQVSTPITVRFATGRVEVWNDAPPTIEFKQAACAAKTMPIHSPRDCVGCPLRVPSVIPQNAIQVARHAKANATATPPIASTQTNAVAPTAPARAKPSAQPARATAKRAVNSIAKDAPVLIESNAAESETLSQAAADLIARAKATAQKKAAEQAAIAQAAQRVAAEERATYAPTPEPKSKIIQIQQWLAGQMTRKQANQPLPVTPDEDGVSEIVYAPLGAPTAQAYQETMDYERCVGWTD
jgi:pyruvate/2-oxoglutarate dehydrogenase complex dihydrolipoamide acyltransferase (E2) component